MRLVIANPSSCGGKAKEVSQRFIDFLEKNQQVYILYTTNAEENTNTIQSLITQHKIENISILGGDGTINIAINALPHLDFNLHLIPAGTGNDLAKMLYGSYSEKTVFQLVLDTKSTKEIDCWKCNEYRFCNGFGAGFDGAVAHSMFRKTYILPTKLKYWIEIFRHIFGYRSNHVSINGKPTPVFMLSAANGKVYGGGFNVAPLAEADDELLDIITISKVSVLKRFLYLPKIEKGKHLHLKEINRTQLNKIEIKAERPLPAHLDGEPILSDSYSIYLEGKMRFAI